MSELGDRAESKRTMTKPVPGRCSARHTISAAFARPGGIGHRNNAASEPMAPPLTNTMRSQQAGMALSTKSVTALRCAQGESSGGRLISAALLARADAWAYYVGGACSTPAARAGC